MICGEVSPVLLHETELSITSDSNAAGGQYKLIQEPEELKFCFISHVHRKYYIMYFGECLSNKQWLW